MKLIFVVFSLFFSISGVNGSINVQDELNLDKILKNANFVKGYVIKAGVEVPSKILQFKRKDLKKYYMCCIIKDQNDSVLVYTANDVDGYGFQGEKYIKYRNEDFFIRLKITGKVELYERERIPEDSRSLYYIKFKGAREYIVYEPSIGTIANYHSMGDVGSENNQGFHHIPNKTKAAFEIFVSEFFGGCEKVRNLISLGIYDANELPAIIKAYNSCH